MNEIALLPMSLQDIADVLMVEKVCFTQPWSREAFEEQILSPWTCYLVAKAGGRLLGYAGMYVILEDAHVTNVAVHPDARGQGLGRRLMEALIERAVRRGALRMDLEVRESNAVAQGLYRSLCFHSVGRRPAYYDHPREDALILRLEPLTLVSPA